MNEEHQPGTEQGGQPRGTPGGEAEDMPRSDEELRARLEEQLGKLRVQDLMVESVVSVLNLTARRIAKEDERDLEQARIGIEAIRAWVELLPDEAAKQVREALSELQMLYAREADAAAAPGPEPEPEPDSPEQGKGPAEGPRQPGAEPPPRLWTPPGSD